MSRNRRTTAQIKPFNQVQDQVQDQAQFQPFNQAQAQFQPFNQVQAQAQIRPFNQVQAQAQAQFQPFNQFQAQAQIRPFNQVQAQAQIQPLTFKQVQNIKTACENLKIALEWIELYFSKTIPNSYNAQIHDRKIARDDITDPDDFHNSVLLSLTSLKVTVMDQPEIKEELERKFYEWFDNVKVNPFASKGYSDKLIECLTHARDVLQNKGDKAIRKRMIECKIKREQMGEEEFTKNFYLMFESYNHVLNEKEEHISKLFSSNPTPVYSEPREIIDDEIRFDGSGNSNMGKFYFDEMEDKFNKVLL